MKILMKMLVILLGFFILMIPVFGENNISQKVGELKNGDTYIEIIDRFIEQNKTDEQRLITVQEKLQVILENFEQNKYISIFEYLNQQISVILQLQSIGEDIDNIIDEVIIDEVTIEKNNSSVDNIILFPGFDNLYNDQDKNILGGTEVEIYSADINARLEEIEIGKVIIYINTTNPAGLKNSIDDAKLYLEGSMLDESSGGKIDVISASQIKIEFSNMKDFILTRNKREYRIALKTHNIGQDYLGEIVDNFYVTRVGFDDIKGLTTGDSLSEISFTQKGANNSVLPIELIINQNNYSGINSVEFNILGNFGNNLAYQSGNNKSVNIEELRFRPYGSQYLDEYSYELINRDFPEQSVVGVYSNGFLTFEVSDLGENARTITDSKNGEDFEISMTHPIRKDNINLNLQRDGILFTISNHLGPITTRFEKTIDLESNNN